jgi:hypothetical protein
VIAATIGSRWTFARLSVALLVAFLALSGRTDDAGARQRPAGDIAALSSEGSPSFGLLKHDDDDKDKEKKPKDPGPPAPEPPAPEPTPPAPALEPAPPAEPVPPASPPPPPEAAPAPEAEVGTPPPSDSASEQQAEEQQDLPHYLPDVQPAPPPPAPPTPQPVTQMAEVPSVVTETFQPNVGSAYQAAPEFGPVAPAQPAPDDFEDSARGWKGANATLTVVPGVRGKAVRVTKKGSRESFAFYAPKRLVSRRAGTPYKVGALVRSTSPGMYLCLRAEERGGGMTRTTERCAPARSGWRRVALKGMTAAKGHKLVFSVHVLAAVGGTSFDVDGFKLAA